MTTQESYWNKTRPPHIELTNARLRKIVTCKLSSKLYIRLSIERHGFDLGIVTRGDLKEWYSVIVDLNLFNPWNVYNERFGIIRTRDPWMNEILFNSPRLKVWLRHSDNTQSRRTP